MASNRLAFIQAEGPKIDEVVGNLLVSRNLTLVSRDNIASFFEEGSAVLDKSRLVVPGYLVKKGVPTCNTTVAKLICYLVAQSRRRGILLTFVAPSREYLDGRIRRYIQRDEEGESGGF